MAKKPFIAVFLSLLMFSGCFGAESETEVDDDQVVVIPYSISASWDKQSVTGEIGEILELSILIQTTGEGTFSIDSDIKLENESISSSDWSINTKPTYISIIMLPNTPGIYEIDVKISPSEGDEITMSNTVDILVPDEGTTSLVAPQYLVVESSMLVLQGKVLHESLNTCLAQIDVPEEDSTVNSNSLTIQSDGSFTSILTDLDLRTESFVVTISAQCGQYTLSEDLTFEFTNGL